MTKERTPLSIENTLRVVLGELEVERAAELTGRSTGYLNSLTDEDKREQLNVRDLEMLDLEHHSRFGRGFPLFRRSVAGSTPPAPSVSPTPPPMAATPPCSPRKAARRSPLCVRPRSPPAITRR